MTIQKQLCGIFGYSFVIAAENQNRITFLKRLLH